MQLKSRLFLMLSSLYLIQPAFAQTPDSFIKLPYEMLFEIKGIKTKLIFESITTTPEGSIAELTLGFQHPQTGQWIYFEAENVGMSNTGGLHPPFDFTLKKEYKRSDTNFISEILTLRTDRTFFWKCQCEETLPKFPI